jgi:hypothetical protein
MSDIRYDVGYAYDPGNESYVSRVHKSSLLTALQVNSCFVSQLSPAKIAPDYFSLRVFAILHAAFLTIGDGNGVLK